MLSSECWGGDRSGLPNNIRSDLRRLVSRIASLLLGVVLGTFLLGCTSSYEPRAAEDSESVSGSRAVQSQFELDQCDARGGEVKSVCRLGLPSCVLPYADAGKSCSDSSECEGACWLVMQEGDKVQPGDSAVGECQPDSNICGCNFEILGGAVQPGLCVD